MATRAGTPARIRFQAAVRRQSCRSRWDTPARPQASRKAYRHVRTVTPRDQKWSHFFARLQKDKFDPVWESHYLVYRGGLSLPRVLADVGRGARGRRLPASAVHRARRANRADIRGALPSDRRDRRHDTRWALSDGRSRRDRTRMHMRRFTRLTNGFSRRLRTWRTPWHYTTRTTISLRFTRCCGLLLRWK